MFLNILKDGQNIRCQSLNSELIGLDLGSGLAKCLKSWVKKLLKQPFFGLKHTRGKEGQ